jgi:hypothetical protein
MMAARITRYMCERSLLRRTTVILDVTYPLRLRFEGACVLGGGVLKMGRVTSCGGRRRTEARMPRVLSEISHQ